MNIGLVGYGRWGPNYYRTFGRVSDAKISAVCDINEQILSKIPGNILKTTNYDDLITNESLDALVIATPPTTHYELTKKALDAGKNVLVEKPLVLRTDHAKELEELAQKSDKILMVGHIHDYNPVVNCIANEIKEGTLGKLAFAQATMGANGPIRGDVSVLWDWGPHVLTVLNRAIGEYPLDVSARGATYVSTKAGLEDVINMDLTYPSGVFASAFFSWMIPKKRRDFMFVGDEKYLVADDVAVDDRVCIYDRGPQDINLTKFGDFIAYPTTVRTGGMVSPYVPNDEPLFGEVVEFVSAIREKRTPVSSVKNAVKIIATLEAAQKSMDLKGRSVDICGYD